MEENIAWRCAAMRAESAIVASRVVNMKLSIGEEQRFQAVATGVKELVAKNSGDVSAISSFRAVTLIIEDACGPAIEYGSATARNAAGCGP